MSEKKWKLNYKVKPSRRPLLVSGASSQQGQGLPDKRMEMIDVEWTHEDGFPEDIRTIPFRLNTIETILDPLLKAAVKAEVIGKGQAEVLWDLIRKVFVPQDGAPEIGILSVPDGRREVLVDQINVPEGTPTSIVMQMLEEKRKDLAKRLGVEP